MKKFTERIVAIRGEGEHVCNHCNVAAIKAKMKQLRRMRQHRCLSAKKTGAQRRGEREEGWKGEERIDKKGETEREAWRTRDRRPSISIALRLSLWLGFSVPFSHKSYIVSSLRSYGRGLKYSFFLPAARIHRKAGRRQTYRTWHTYAKSNSNVATIVSIVRWHTILSGTFNARRPLGILLSLFIAV